MVSKRKPEDTEEPCPAQGGDRFFREEALGAEYVGSGQQGPGGGRYVGIMRVAALLLAAGRGERLGASLPKALLPLGERPLWAHAAEVLAACADVQWIIPVAPADFLAQFRATEMTRAARSKLCGAVAGGAERQDSMRAGLRALPEGAAWVAVHDAARPFITGGDVARVVAAARQEGAALLALPAPDTVKRVREERIVETPPRSECYLAQTPQVFRSELLRRALARASADGFTGTDDAQLVERLGHRVRVVAGNPRNRKITHPEDLAWAAAELVRRDSAPDAQRGAAEALQGSRVGQGFDAHRLAVGRPLWLGGIRVPCERGLAGHSDGDVLLHAVASALLGAAGEGDLGEHFPSSDPALRGIASAAILERVLALLGGRGLCVVNLDATVIAQWPRLSPHRAAMAGRVATLLSLPPDRVNVKITSTDGLGALGRGEGIAAQVSVLLAPIAPEPAGSQLG